MSDNENNDFDGIEIQDNEDIKSYKKKLKKVRERDMEHFMVTIKAYDNPRLDTKANMQELIDGTCGTLTREHWITGLGHTMEWNTKDQFDESWMWFPHHHAHIPGTCERRNKHDIKKNIRTLLTGILPENKFDKHWIVFGAVGRKQLANYITYCMKQNGFAVWKGFEDIESLAKEGKKFYNDERKKFNYGLTFDDKIATTVRVIEKEIYHAGWGWKIINHNIVWINNSVTGQTVISNSKMRKIFMTLTRYRVFRNKLFRCIGFVFGHVTDFLCDLCIDS